MEAKIANVDIKLKSCDNNILIIKTNHDTKTTN